MRRSLWLRADSDVFLDDAVAVHGMPIGLQIVGRRLEEEKTLAMTETILEALK